MFDFSFGELLLLGVVALVVLGPEKLPHTMRMIGAWVGRIRRTVINIQAEIEKEVQAQEMKQRIEQEMAKLSQSDLAHELQTQAASLKTGLQDMQGQMQPIPAAGTTPVETLHETPVAEAEPEKPGEDAFKAHVQSSHAKAVAQATASDAISDHAGVEPEHKPAP